MAKKSKEMQEKHTSNKETLAQARRARNRWKNAN